MENTLLFFTSQFPYGSSETFIENEISFLSLSFKKIYIFPGNCKGEKRIIPENCEIIDGYFNDEGYNRNRLIIHYFRQIISLFYSELGHRGIKTKKKGELFSQCLHMVYKASSLEKFIKDMKLQQAIYYTYWMEDWSTILSILKHRGTIKRLISRAHGFDIYEERQANGLIRWRKFQLKNIDFVYSVSKEGEKYLIQNYPSHKYKFKTSYLGTKDYGMGSIKLTPHLHIVSASNIIPLKRLHLIIEILKHVKIGIVWTHFGDGVLMKEVLKLSKSLSPNVTIDFKGRKSNKEMLMFLKETPISFFINVSDSEGLPVSIMEAISFGIPIIATNVGGTNEIVNDKTGILIEPNFNPKLVSIYLNNFFDSKYATINFRKGVREFWLDYYKANQNYNSFIMDI